MTGTFLTSLADVARRTGLPVVERSGWRQRSNNTGGFRHDRPLGVCMHHTASHSAIADDLAFSIDNSDNAPEYNVMIARDGTLHVCAAGGVNGQGKGGPWRFSRGTADENKSNNQLVAVSYCYDGVGEVMSRVQYMAGVALCRELLVELDLQVGDVISHKEWVQPTHPGRKIDPHGPLEPGTTGAAVDWGPKFQEGPLGLPNIDAFRGAVWLNAYPGDMASGTGRVPAGNRVTIVAGPVVVRSGGGRRTGGAVLPAGGGSLDGSPFDPGAGAFDGFPAIAIADRPLLKPGSQGDWVRFLQGVLILRTAHQKVVVSGRYDGETERAVRDTQAFFRALGWRDSLGEAPSVDGKVGDQTWELVNLLVASPT